jgi:hypothetical protein
MGAADGGVGTGGGPGRTTGPAVSAGPGLIGTPLPPCCTRGAAGATAAGAGGPASTGAPAGTPASTGAPPGAPAGTGAPAGATGGPGRTTGAAGAASPDICSTQVGPPDDAASPAVFSTHTGPPIGRGAADAPGLNAKAAPHNPALAAIVMPNRSNIFNANSPVFGLR